MFGQQDDKENEDVEVPDMPEDMIAMMRKIMAASKPAGKRKAGKIDAEKKLHALKGLLADFEKELDAM